jgi:hypothetical protein
MLSMKLLLAFGLLTGIFVDQCDLGDFAVADFSDQVTVTNASTVGYAIVAVSFNHNSVMWKLPAGSSKTASGFAPTDYTVQVLGPSLGMWASYEDRLLTARDEIVALTTNPSTPPDKVMDAAAELPLIVEALQQLEGSRSVQSCTAKIKTGVVGQATVTYTKLTDGTGLWVLTCK